MTVEVIHDYLLSAAREMNRNLVRTAYNTIVYEVRDFGLGIYVMHARLLAEAPGLAIFTRVNDYGLRTMIEYLGRRHSPGRSDPAERPVLALAPQARRPCLDADLPWRGADRASPATRSTGSTSAQKDVGYVLDSTSIGQEGLMMPCSKIYTQGVLNTNLEELIRFNGGMH